MHNAPKPKLEDLPTKWQFRRSSVISGIGAVFIGLASASADFMRPLRDIDVLETHITPDLEPINADFGMFGAHK